MRNRFKNSMPLEDRFLANVKKTDSCWIWTGHTNQFGYGRIEHNGVKHLVHRYSYELNNPKIPEGMIACHRCDNRRCVNPKHIYIGTCYENSQDAVRRNRTAFGERNANAKLSEKDVHNIKEELSKFSQRKIASKYGVDSSLISQIKRGVIWKRSIAHA